MPSPCQVGIPVRNEILPGTHVKDARGQERARLRGPDPIPVNFTTFVHPKPNHSTSAFTLTFGDARAAR